MLWITALLLAIVVCGALFWVTRRKGVGVDGDAAATAFYRSQLAGIDEDAEAGRLSPEEATAAKAELAREFMRHEQEATAKAAAGPGPVVIGGVLASVLAASFGLYLAIGRADLPAQPLAEREIATNTDITLEEAVARVEAQMVETPNDVRGWLALAPIYMQSGRYTEAVNAYRRVIDLDGATADRETDLAEAMIMVNEGAMTPEAMTLLRSAAERDPEHVRSRFYIAGELTRSGDYASAIPAWEYLLSLGTGEEPWIATARAGLDAALAGQRVGELNEPVPDATTDIMIRGMVEGLAARLYDEGGSAEEWMQLVRSRNVLDGAEAARDDLERGLAALEGEDRLALQALAEELGLMTEQQ
ncbi:c-type cytochrome biogenesis protein CcmI [Pelagibacterium halotolerans]|uniref:c-type cytochrome biogenesis protein CcmI n=1 Tax=Pelagibacterium halotolerans TaxID=531813 RepID=UPI0038506D22